jgi:hypothetical protein
MKFVPTHDPIAPQHGLELAALALDMILTPHGAREIQALFEYFDNEHNQMLNRDYVRVNAMFLVRNTTERPVGDWTRIAWACLVLSIVAPLLQLQRTITEAQLKSATDELKAILTGTEPEQTEQNQLTQFVRQLQELKAVWQC